MNLQPQPTEQEVALEQKAQQPERLEGSALSVSAGNVDENPANLRRLSRFLQRVATAPPPEFHQEESDGDRATPRIDGTARTTTMRENVRAPPLSSQGIGHGSKFPTPAPSDITDATQRSSAIPKAPNRDEALPDPRWTQHTGNTELLAPETNTRVGLDSAHTGPAVKQDNLQTSSQKRKAPEDLSGGEPGESQDLERLKLDLENLEAQKKLAKVEVETTAIKKKMRAMKKAKLRANA